MTNMVNRLQPTRGIIFGRYPDSARAYVGAVLLGLILGLACLISPLVGIGILASGVFVGVAFQKPVFLCYSIIAATIFTGGLERGRLIPLVVPSEAILILSAAISAPIILFKRGAMVTIPRAVVLAQVVLIGGIVILPTVGYYVRGLALSTSDLFSLLAPIKYVIIFWLFSFLPETDADRHRLLYWMLICGAVVSIIGLMQGLNVPGVANFLSQWYPSDQTLDAGSYGRVTSLLRAWNALGVYLMLMLLLILALQPLERSRRSQLIVLVSLACAGACLLASGSFAGILGVGMGLLIIKYFDRRGLRIILMLLVGLAISIVLLQPLISQRLQYQFGSGDGTTPQTLAYRFQVWRNVIFPALKDNVLLGISPTLANLNFPYAESQYIYLLFRSGLISLAAHLFWVAMMLYCLYQKMRTSTDLKRALALAAFTIITVLSIIGLTNEVFTFTGSTEYLWIICALALTARKEQVA